MRSLVIGLVIGATAVSANNAYAQTCAGNASFASGPAQVGAGFSVTDGAKAYGVQGALGYQTGLYGLAQVSRTSPDGGGDGVTSLGIAGGYSMDVTPDKKLQFCPSVGYQYHMMPDQLGESVSGYTLTAGGSFGTVMPASPTLDFVPAAGIFYRNNTVSFAGESTSDGYASLDVAAGFVMKKQWTIQPSVSFPFSDGYNTVFNIGVNYSFGGAPSAAKPTPAPATRRR